MANTLLTQEIITREALALLRSENVFLTYISLSPAPMKIDAAVEALKTIVVTPQAAVAMAIAAAVVKNPTVTRRFWDPRTWAQSTHQGEPS